MKYLGGTSDSKDIVTKEYGDTNYALKPSNVGATGQILYNTGDNTSQWIDQASMYDYYYSPPSSGGSTYTNNFMTISIPGAGTRVNLLLLVRTSSTDAILSISLANPSGYDSISSLLIRGRGVVKYTSPSNYTWKFYFYMLTNYPNNVYGNDQYIAIKVLSASTGSRECIQFHDAGSQPNEPSLTFYNPTDDLTITKIGSTNKGSTTNPIYLNRGVPTACTYTLSKSVPADAVFTDTTYGVANTTTLGLVKSGTDITVDASGNVSVNDDSHNHIISNIDGLQSALDNIEKRTTINLFDYTLSSLKALNIIGTWSNNVYTVGSMTITVNDDLTITLNGTNTQAIYFVLHRNLLLKQGTYTLSGCPLQNNVYLEIHDTNYYNDFGAGRTFTTNDTTVVGLICVRADNTDTLSNLVLKPMIELGTLKHSYVQSIGKDNFSDAIVDMQDEFSDAIVGMQDELNVIGGQTTINLLSYRLDSVKTLNGAGTWLNNVFTLNGIDYTFGTDGTITANGTCSEAYSYILLPISLAIGTTYTVSGGVNNNLLIAVRNTALNVSYGVDTGNGATFTAEVTDTRLMVRVNGQGTVVNNVVFKPMLEIGTVKHDYVSSIGTNNFSDAITNKSDISHTHDDRYYTESEIDTKLSGKANSSHTHIKSQITDFPTSMPASDVYAWAKAATKPSYTASEVGAVATSPDGTHALLSNNKVTENYLPDYLLGQVLYGGNIAGSTATLTVNAKSKLGTTSNTITLTNDTTAITGYKANEGIYYIATNDSTFAGLSILTGDWLISNGSSWRKIDNTDAVTGVKGSSESTYRVGNVDISKANIGLGNVDNTSDTSKPISTAQQTALNGKESLIKNATTKTSIVDNDTIPLSDSAASNATKKISFSTIKSTLKTYFDTLYNKYVHPTYTSKTNGLYKVTVDSTGHVSATTTVAKSDITGLGIPGSDTNTTYSLSKEGSTIKLTGSDGNTTSVIDSNTTYGIVSTTAAGLAPQRTGTTTKYLRDDGTWAVPTDTNTWRGIQDNLTSTSTTDSLSAKQGNILNEALAGKASSSHTHNYAGSSSAGGAATTALTCTGNAATATKATQDASGNVITSTYATKSSVNAITAALGGCNFHIISSENEPSTAPDGSVYFIYDGEELMV